MRNVTLAVEVPDEHAQHFGHFLEGCVVDHTICGIAEFAKYHKIELGKATVVVEAVDFVIADHGTLVSLAPMTKKAKEATGEGGIIESQPWQWLGCSLMVDHRMADNLIENLRNDGFSIGNE
jgi:hypothetical protein